MLLNGPLQMRDHLGGDRHRRRLVVLAGLGDPERAAPARRAGSTDGPEEQALPWWDAAPSPLGDEVHGPNHWEGALSEAVAPWANGASTPPCEQQWDPDSYLSGPYFDGVWQ